jgi:hypothetical protein
MCGHFGKQCSIFIGHVNKNNWDETARVILQVKVWLKRSLGQLEGAGMGTGHVRVEEQAVEGNSHKWRLVVRQVHTAEMAPC